MYVDLREIVYALKVENGLFYRALEIFAELYNHLDKNPDNEAFRQIKPVFMRASGFGKTPKVTSLHQMVQDFVQRRKNCIIYRINGQSRNGIAHFQK